jgi:outer membrane protein
MKRIPRMHRTALTVLKVCGAAAALSAAAAWPRPLRAQPVAQAVPLSMQDAIKRAIETNLENKLARAATQETRGQALEAAASLLPQLTGTLSQSRVFKQNLEALGFSGGNALIPNIVIGPYDVFDARLNLTWKLLDVSTIYNTKEARARDRVAHLQVDLAGEQVAAAAALAYIENLRALHDVEDAKTNLALAQRLLILTQHQHGAGVATGVDLARAETRVSVDHQNLIQADLSAYEADIRLKRVIGAALTDNLVLNAPPDETPQQGPEENQAIGIAEAERVELRIAGEQVAAETYGLSAAKADFLPRLSAAADYGFSGDTPDGTARTGSVGGRMDWPLFSGFSTKGRIEETKGRRLAAQNTYDDIRIQLEEDVRLAGHTLLAEKDDVDAAEERARLAERELTLARDRYGAGAGDNIQVVTAQASLSDALKSRVDARARYLDAKVNMAAALGRMRTFHF